MVTAGLTNCGILGRTTVEARLFSAGTITIDMFGNAFYRDFEYKMVTHARVFSLMPRHPLPLRQGLFVVNAFHALPSRFGYDNMCSWEKIKDESIALPITSSGEPDYTFMESCIAELEAERIAELEAYLAAAGLTDCRLTAEEQQAVDCLDGWEWGEYCLRDLFNNIRQGRRLKKEDQMPGDIPFVMSGTTNTGVINYVSNPVAVFPANSLTVDIFGNTFYRSYAYGAGDDTGVYWNSAANYTEETMLFFAAVIGKVLAGKYDYGHKLRSSQSLDFKMPIPVTAHGAIDYERMSLLIRAVEKLVVSDVSAYSSRRVAATRAVAGR